MSKTVNVTVNNKNASSKILIIAYAETGTQKLVQSDAQIIPGNAKTEVAVELSSPNPDTDVGYTVIIAEGLSVDNYMWVNQACKFKDENKLSFEIGVISPLALTMYIVCAVLLAGLVLLALWLALRKPSGTSRDASAYSTSMLQPPTSSEFSVTKEA